MFKKFFKKKNEEIEESLVAVPIPAFITTLYALEQKTGVPLTRDQVEELRDNAVCMMLPLSAIEKMEEERGYPDIRMSDAWDDWQQARLQLFK